MLHMYQGLESTTSPFTLVMHMQILTLVYQFAGSKIARKQFH